jgi:hypothetical protein
MRIGKPGIKRFVMVLMLSWANIALAASGWTAKGETFEAPFSPKLYARERTMSKIMFQFRHRGESPSVEQVRATFGLRADEVDADYGVVQTDSLEGLYTILVDESAQAKIEERLKQMGAEADPRIGFFSNPRIEPFGPPIPDAKNER